MNKLAYKNYIYLPYRLILFYFYLFFSIYQIILFRNNFKLVKGLEKFSSFLSFKTFEFFEIYLQNENKDISVSLKDGFIKIDNENFEGSLKVFDNKIIFENYFKLYKFRKNFLIEIEKDNNYILTEVKFLESYVFKNFTENIIVYKGQSEEFKNIIFIFQDKNSLGETDSLSSQNRYLKIKNLVS